MKKKADKDTKIDASDCKSSVEKDGVIYCRLKMKTADEFSSYSVVSKCDCLFYRKR